MELEESSAEFILKTDPRPKMPEPPPVRLVAVNDVELPSVAGLETELDKFYIGLLAFERDSGESGIVYRAENFRMRFIVNERPQPREDFRGVGVEVPNFSEIIARLNDAEIEFLRQRGLASGQESLLVLDPAGNWIEIFEMKPLT